MNSSNRFRYSACRFVVSILLLAFAAQANAQDKVRESFLAIQKQVAALQPRLVETTVALTVSQGRGSGVLISPDGYVLTAGHVSGRPNQRCRVTLADGRSFEATTLGCNAENDFGLVKINEAENLPVAPLGDSATLRPGEWVLALGHPLGRKMGRPPVVRIGRVLRTPWRRREGEARRITTDAPLISGDSGGPLFDLNGRVVAINSMIAGGEEWAISMHSAVNPAKGVMDLLKRAELIKGPQGRPESFTKPLDDGKAALADGQLADAISYFKTCESIEPTDAGTEIWLAHAYARSGKSLLAAERIAKGCQLGFNDAGTIRTDPDFSSLVTNSMVSAALTRLDLWNGLPGDRKTERGFLTAAANLSGRSERGVVDVQVDGKDAALGIVMSASGDILTKASEVKGGSVACLLSDGKLVAAEVKAVDSDWDVALLKIKADGLRPLTMTELSPTSGWVFTPERTGAFVAAGFVGVAEMPVRGKGIGALKPTAVMGVVTEEASEQTLRGMGLKSGLKFADVRPAMPADKAGIKAGDVIYEVDRRPIAELDTLSAYLAIKKPGDVVNVKVARGSDKLDFSVTLVRPPADWPVRGPLPLEVSGEVSVMQGPFARVFHHDSVLKPDQIGGPVFDLDGKCVGMNIARADRTSTYAIEPRDLREIYARLRSR